MKFKKIGKSKMLTKLPLVFFVSFISFGYLAAGSSEEQAITKTLRNYIDGPNEKNIVGLKSAFAETATILFVRDSKLVEIKLEDFFRHMEAGWADPQEHAVVAREILLIDVFDNAAIAKIQANFSDGKAIDYISLLKVADKWLIVNKIFSFK
ncbi:nuclear transport factor 2 family protein [candidate division KSB1 bacterium]|nr:nuclear transport factor 2 family protein [candidate division KSB1 bacterium]